MHHYVGVYALLAALPIWATVAFLASLGLIIVVGRDRLEGLPYQVAYSALVGDTALAVGVVIGVGILQRGNATIPAWLQSGTLRAVILYGSTVAGGIIFFITRKKRSAQHMDLFHDVVVAPVFAYLGTTLLPVIWYSGTVTEQVATACFILIWVGAVVYDLRDNRMNQRDWLERNHYIYLDDNRGG